DHLNGDSHRLGTARDGPRPARHEGGAGARVERERAAQAPWRQANWFGFGPRRAEGPLSRALIASISSEVRVRSREAKLETMRLGVTDLVITMLPSARFQASSTWPASTPWDSAIFVTTGPSSSPPPRPSGDQASVRVFLLAWCRPGS